MSERAPTAAAGIVWAGISQAGRVLIQLIALAILSRLLPPTDFGLLAMATVVTTFALLLRDMGTSAAVIQRDQLGDELLDTVFWFNVCLGAGLAIAILLLALPLAAVFREPRLQGVLFALAASFPLGSSAAVHQGLLERDLNFRKLARIELSSGLAALAVAAIAAWQGLGVYSLVLNTLTNVLLTTVQLWFASRWRPRFRWSATEFRALWGFSSNLVSFQVINYFARNVDTFLIGRFLGAADLGWYNTAYRIMLFPLSNLSGVLSRVMFPVLSRQQADLKAFATLYLRTVSAISLITAPLMAGLWVVRQPFIEVLLGKAWLPVADVIAWLAPVGMIQSVGTTVGLIYMATGSTRLMMRWGFVASAVIVTAFIVGLRWGYLGVAAAYAFANLILLYPVFTIPLRLVGLTFTDLLRAVGRQLVSAVFMGSILFGIDYFFLAGLGAWAKLLVLVPTGLVIYAVTGWLWMRSALLDVTTAFSRRGGKIAAAAPDVRNDE